MKRRYAAHAQDDDLAVEVATLEQLLDAHQLAHAHPSGSSADIIAGQILPFAPEPVGAIGLQGTTVWGGPIDGGYGVIVLSGEVTVTGRRGNCDFETRPGNDALRRRQTPSGPTPGRQGRMTSAPSPQSPSEIRRLDNRKGLGVGSSLAFGVCSPPCGTGLAEIKSRSG